MTMAMKNENLIKHINKKMEIIRMFTRENVRILNVGRLCLQFVTGLGQSNVNDKCLSICCCFCQTRIAYN